MKNVGKSPQRYDVPPKVDGSLKWAVDMKVPGMVHARNVRPPFAGATLVSIDESSVKSIPGLIKVVSKGNYVAVVCEREENAIRAARQLKVQWQKPATAPFPASEDLFKYMRAANPSSTGKPVTSRQSRGGIRQCGHRDRSRVRRAVPGPHLDRPRACARRSLERSADDLFQRHEVVRHAEQRGAVPQHAARPRARDLDGRPAGLRPHRGRRCGVRGGVSGEGDRPAGAHAVDAPGRNRVGHQGSGLRGEASRRPRRAGQSRGAALRRVRRRSQSPRLQRARHGADLAADGHAPRQTSRPAARRCRRTCMRSRTGCRPRAWCRCRCRSRRRFAPATCAIPMVRR